MYKYNNNNKIIMILKQIKYQKNLNTLDAVANENLEGKMEQL